MAGFPAAFWPHLIGSLAERVVIFHITAHPLSDMSKMGKINIHTATKTRLHKINATYLIKQYFHKPEQKMHEWLSVVKWQVCILAPVSGMSALQDILSPIRLPADSALVSSPSGHSGLSDGSEPK